MLCTELLHVLKYFPPKVSSAVSGFAEMLHGKDSDISEIRLRAYAPMSLTYRDRNICRFRGEYVICSDFEVSETLQRLCEDSVHTYSETMKDGFVTLENGYRIGVCGRVGSDAGHIKGVYGISSISIRIPHAIPSVSRDINNTICQESRILSALFYSPPGVGKTTLIRDIAVCLSKGETPHRVAVVDTRAEIYVRSMFENSIADILSGYPRAKGIEIATRTMSPEVIICDEIGSAEEATAILSAQNSGVPLIATAHADSFSSLLKRPNIRVLHESGIFRFYIGVRRLMGTSRFLFEIEDTGA